MAPCLSICLGGIGAGLVNESAKPLLEDLRTRILHFLHRKENASDLKKKLEALNVRRVDVERSVEEAQRRDNVIKDEVSAWLHDVTELNDKVHAEEEELAVRKGCFKGFILYCCDGHKMGKQASEERDDASELLKISVQFQNGNVSTARGPPSIEDAPMGDFRAFGSTKKAMARVMDALNNGSTHLIGIYGMGGVGKTTLMEHIGRKLKEDSTFDTVITVVVSQNPNIDQIRREIADQLGMIGGVGVGDFAARKLAHRLRQEKKVVIMLDDIWERLDLKEVGIPYGRDLKEGCICKILLTSRKSQVCHAMEAHVLVLVDILSAEDSWSLFRSKAGGVVESPNVEPVAQKMAGECGGLPLALVGSEGSNLENCTRISLSNNDISTLPQCPNRPLLVTLLLNINPLSNGLPDNFFDAMDALHILDLSETNIRSLPSSIALLTNLIVLCLNGCRELRHISYVGGLTTLKMLQLQKCKVQRLPEEIGNLVNLRLLELSHSISLIVPYNLLHKLSRLEELYVSGCKRVDGAIIGEIVSLQYLTRLELFLDGNNDPTAADVILNAGWANLTHFLVYNVLHWSSLRSMYQKNLYLNGVSQLKRWPKCLLSGTEDLQLNDCKLDSIDLAALDEHKGFENLKKLDITRCDDVKYLLKVEASEQPPISNAYCQLELLKVVNMNDFVAICTGILPANSFRNLMKIHIERCKNVVEPMPEDLLKRVNNKLQDLSVIGLDNPQVILSFQSFQQQDHPILPNLRALKLQVLKSLVRIWHGVFSPRSLQNLSSLDLHSCNSLEHLFSQKSGSTHLHFLPLETFRSLKKLKVSRCGSLKYLFSPSIVNKLHSLEVLEVKDYASMEEIITLEDNVLMEEGAFPALKEMSLVNLPNLSVFYQGEEPHISFSWPLVRSLNLVGCPKLQRLPVGTGAIRPYILPLETFKSLKTMKVSLCGSLKYLFSPSVVNKLHSLEVLEVKDNASMEEIITVEDNVLMKEGAFPALKDLSLVNLPNLSDFYQGEPHISFSWPSLKSLNLGGCPRMQRLPVGTGATRPYILPLETFRSLKTLKVSLCGSLKYLFWPSSVNKFQRLEVLEVKDNAAMEEIILMEEGAFPALKDLSLVRLPNLSGFYQGEPHISFSWPSLTSLKLGGCPTLQRLPVGTDSAPHLKIVHLVGNSYIHEMEWFRNLEWTDSRIPSRFKLIREANS